MSNYYNELIEARERILFELDELAFQIKQSTNPDEREELRKQGNHLFYVELDHVEQEIDDYERGAML